MFKLKDSTMDKAFEVNHVKDYWHHISDSLTIDDPKDVELVREFNEAVSVLLKGCRKPERQALIRLIRAMRRLYTNNAWAEWHNGVKYGQWGELIFPPQEGERLCGITVSKELAKALQGVPKKDLSFKFVHGEGLKDLNILGGHLVIINTKAFPVAGDVTICTFGNGSQGINTFLGPASDGAYAVLPGAVERIRELKALYAKEVGGVVLASVEFAGEFAGKVYYKRKRQERVSSRSITKLIRGDNIV
ncbi:MAG: hypothetical protein A4E55_00561 [Pelotomaculum sp. PtaU1.Bin035]|nr:MAG: hypothetical protein A4E55_00561 [Pelotomaculum sp. PtaU1.Bin035]